MTLERFLKVTPCTQEQLAAAAQVDQSTLSRLVRGERKASVWLALRLERATDGQVRAEDVPMSRQAKRDLAALRKTTLHTGDAA